MSWPVRALIGPCLWALAFTTLYSLHGAGCAWGWSERPGLFSSLQVTVLGMGYVLFLALGLGALVFTPQGPERGQRIARAGSWIGLGATALTLFPVLVLPGC